MPKPRNMILDYVAYLAARLLTVVDHIFSWPIRYRVAAFFGSLVFMLDRKHRHRAMEHLARSFPDWTIERRRQVARESFLSMAYMVMEVLIVNRMIRPQTWRRYITMRNMAEVTRRLVQRDGGLILVTGHFGNWEVAGYMTSAVGLPTVTVARRDRNPFLHAYVTRLRQAAGQQMMDKDGASEQAGPVLEANGVLTMVCDQDAGRKGMFVDFFGRPASTYKSIGLLAMTYRAPICVIYCRRLSNDYRFEIGAERIILPSQWDAQDDPLRWITQEYTAALEAVVRRNPEQYFWVHRRWKHRPRGQEQPADGIA